MSQKKQPVKNLSHPKNLAQQVEQQFRDGYCCSEALVIAATSSYAPGISKELAHAAASGLCGGMGGKQATCGVFTGGAVAISLILGKGVKKDKRIKELSALYHKQLQQHAGGQICQQLLDRMGIRNWNGSRCRLLTKDGGELLQSILDTQLKQT
ncbi:MAG: C-GCAxxG-C-C family protein [Pseudomonadota bacterium]